MRIRNSIHCCSSCCSLSGAARPVHGVCGAPQHFIGGRPLTTGRPDRGAGAYQFTAYTIYDPLVAWEMDVSDRPGKLVPGLATEWKVDDSDKKKWRFTLRQGVKFHDGSDFNADAVIWNLDKVLNDKAPQFDKRQSAQVKARRPALGCELRQDRRTATIEITTKTVDLVLPVSDAVVPGVEPGAIRKARQGLSVRTSSRASLQAPARSS